MQVDDRVWQRMYDAKHWDYYLCELIRVKRSQIRYWSIAVATISTTGIMGWKIWNQYPIYACAIVSAITLIKLNEQNLIPNEKQVEKLNKAMNFYSNFYLKLEKIWFELENNTLTSADGLKELQRLEKSEIDIEITINEVHRKTNKKCDNVAINRVDLFFNSFTN